MTTPIATGAVHHLRLTVSDVARSRAFYTEVLGFRHVMDLPAGVFLSNGSVGLGIGPSPDPARAPSDDRFDEARVGLDHVSFGVASREALEGARRLLDERGVPHGEITEQGAAILRCSCRGHSPGVISHKERLIHASAGHRSAG